jgi:hypothetical protein
MYEALSGSPPISACELRRGFFTATVSLEEIAGRIFISYMAGKIFHAEGW